MPVDKLLMANSAMGAAYGLQVGLAPAKACETFYGETSPSKASLGISKWLGFAQCMSAAMTGLAARSSDEELKMNMKKLGMGFSIAGAGIAAHQIDANGFDKTQAVVAAGANAVFAGLFLKDILKK